MDETLTGVPSSEMPKPPRKKGNTFANILLALIGIGVCIGTWTVGTLLAMYIVPMMGLKEVAACTVGGFLAGWVGRSFVKNDWS